LESVTTAPTVRLDLGSQDFAWHAHERYAELRKQSPVHRLLQPNGTEVWLITRYRDARAALSDPRLSKNAQPVRRALEEAGLVSPVEALETSGPAGHLRLPTRDLLFSDPPEHTRLRHLVSCALTPRRIERLRLSIEALTKHLLDQMALEEEIDLLSAFASPLPITVTCALLGVPVSDRELIRRWADLLQSTNPEGPLAQLSMQTFAIYASELVRATAGRVRHELAADEQPNLLHALLVVGEDEDRLSEAEIVDMLIMLLNSGQETTTNLIGNGTLALLRNRDQWDLLQRHPELLPNAVEELLRFVGPVERATFRFSLEPVTIDGVTIPAHRMVGVLIASADRDPDHFEDPDRLDLSRPRAQHVAFGHGMHFCLGASLARLEAEVAFGGLLGRFPDLELGCPVERLAFRTTGYLIRGLRALPVRPYGRPRVD